MPNSTTAKFNKVKVLVVPNPQYLQTAASDNDTNITKVTEINPIQIKSLEIVKSYQTNTTEATLVLDGVEHNTMARIAEGKEIISISVTPGDSNAKSGAPGLGYFMCQRVIPLGVSKVAGTYPSIKVKIELKSVLLQRLEIENHFTFLLGGNGQYGSAGTGTNPLEFLAGEIKPLFTDAYVAGSSFDPFNLTLAATGIPESVTSTAPPTGYKIEVDTNFKALGFFFEHYPVFKTPYGWLIDDFPTDNVGNNVYIKDFLRYDLWEAQVDVGLSAYLGGEDSPNPVLPSVTKNNNADVPTVKLTANTKTGQNKYPDEYDKANVYTMTKFAIKERVSFYNTGRYLYRDSYPLIYAQSVTDGHPIDTSTWNNQAQTSFVLTASQGYMRVKEMQNPMFKHYLTFLSEKEITETQKYESLFMNLHPELVTYSFGNLWVGELDIHKCIKLKQENLRPEETYGHDRIGTGYHVKHTYTQTHPNPAVTQKQLEDSNDQNADPARLFEPEFALTTELTFLLVDEGPVTLAEYDELTRKYSYQDQGYVVSDLVPYSDINTCGTSTSVDLGDIPTADPGSPGNTSIADSAETLIDNGFVYLWGGTREHAMDCSAFTQYAVRNSGADNGRSTRYPRTTSTQLPWLTQRNNGAQLITDYNQIKAGDIVFFKTSRGPYGHTGIAKSPTEYWHSNSVKKKGADVGTFARRRPSYVFRLKSMQGYTHDQLTEMT